MNSNVIHNIRKHPWGWKSQKEIRRLLIQTGPINKTLIMNKNEFLLGSTQAYRTIHERFCKKKDFTKISYTTPELSLMINHIMHLTKPIKYKPIQELMSKILNSWIEVGNANSNERLFGSWDYNHIKYEFRYINCWDVYVGPFKQKEKVIYKSDKGPIDVW